MRDIDLGPVNRPDEPDPDLVAFGPEPPGAGPPTRRYRWLPSSWQRRPVPRSLVAVVSALVTGVAVAAYLDRPADEPAVATEPAQLLASESWLDVQDAALPDPDRLPGGTAERERWEQAIANHPADATLVLPLPIYEPQLTGLPPGSYRVRASCALGEVPDWVPVREAVGFTVDVREPIGPSALFARFHCDGAVQTAPEPLDVDGYRAYFSEVGFSPEYAEDPEDQLYWSVDQADPVVVVSFSRQ